MKKAPPLLCFLVLCLRSTIALEPPKRLSSSSSSSSASSVLSRHRRFAFPEWSGSKINFYLTATFPVTDAVWPLVITYPYTIKLDTGE